ncbi:hypothetical protein [Gimesia sp.]|uniref:hypothetical protein n=1 Tax=Gimesia sp. TaxID=2024833 RepID=UPI003A90CC0B
MNPEEINRLIKGALWENSVSQIIVSVITLITFCIIYMLSSYAKKKGENLATKEDVESVTKKIESVKLEYQKELKAFERSVINKLELESKHFDSSVNDLLKFYDETTELQVKYLCDAFLWIYLPSHNIEALVETHSHFRNSLLEAMKAFQRLPLYFENNSEIMSLAKDIYLTLVKFERILNDHFGEILTCAIDSTNEDINKTNDERVQDYLDANKAYSAATKPHLEKFAAAYGKFIWCVSEYLRPKFD